LPRGSEVGWILAQHFYSVLEHGALTTSTPASRDEDSYDDNYNSDDDDDDHDDHDDDDDEA
jgi:hypothetical protein